MPSAETIDIDDLARKIAMRMDPEALLDAEDVGAWLKCSGRYVLEHYVLAPGFPRPIRLTLPEGRKSNPRWRRQDISRWIDAHLNGRSTRGGKPRKDPYS